MFILLPRANDEEKAKNNRRQICFARVIVAIISCKKGCVSLHRSFMMVIFIIHKCRNVFSWLLFSPNKSFHIVKMGESNEREHEITNENRYKRFPLQFRNLFVNHPQFVKKKTLSAAKLYFLEYHCVVWYLVVCAVRLCIPLARQINQNNGNLNPKKIHAYIQYTFIIHCRETDSILLLVVFVSIDYQSVIWRWNCLLILTWKLLFSFHFFLFHLCVYFSSFFRGFFLLSNWEIVCTTYDMVGWRRNKAENIEKQRSKKMNKNSSEILKKCIHSDRNNTIGNSFRCIITENI